MILSMIFLNSFTLQRALIRQIYLLLSNSFYLIPISDHLVLDTGNTEGKNPCPSYTDSSRTVTDIWEVCVELT